MAKVPIVRRMMARRLTNKLLKAPPKVPRAQRTKILYKDLPPEIQTAIKSLRMFKRVRLATGVVAGGVVAGGCALSIATMGPKGAIVAIGGLPMALALQYSSREAKAAYRNVLAEIMRSTDPKIVALRNEFSVIGVKGKNLVGLRK